MMYMISEIYTDLDGSTHSPENVIKSDYREAESHYFTALASAAVDTTIKHAVYMFNDEGRMIHSQFFNHVNPSITIPE